MLEQGYSTSIKGNLCSGLFGVDESWGEALNRAWVTATTLTVGSSRARKRKGGAWNLMKIIIDLTLRFPNLPKLKANAKAARRTSLRLSVFALLVLSVILLPSMPVYATLHAQGVVSSDSGGTSKHSFTTADNVYATVTSNGAGSYTAKLWVVAYNPTDGDTLHDASGHASGQSVSVTTSPQTFTVWSSPTTAYPTYYVVLDVNSNGMFDSSSDFVDSSAFSVSSASIVYTTTVSTVSTSYTTTVSTASTAYTTTVSTARTSYTTTVSTASTSTNVISTASTAYSTTVSTARTSYTTTVSTGSTSTNVISTASTSTIHTSVTTAVTVQSTATASTSSSAGNLPITVSYDSSGGYLRFDGMGFTPGGTVRGYIDGQPSWDTGPVFSDGHVWGTIHTTLMPGTHRIYLVDLSTGKQSVTIIFTVM